MFDFLKENIIEVTVSYSDSKHHLYKLNIEEIENLDKIFMIPLELKLFYQEIGYGFFHRKEGAFNRLLDPFSFKQINLKEDYYEFDPDLEIYDEMYQGEKLLFFEINEGNYFAIDKVDINGKNAIYYFERKIASSLEEFLILFDNNPNLLEE